MCLTNEQQSLLAAYAEYGIEEKQRWLDEQPDICCDREEEQAEIDAAIAALVAFVKP